MNALFDRFVSWKERKLSYYNLLKTVGYVFNYRDANDEESIKLEQLLTSQPIKDVLFKLQV